MLSEQGMDVGEWHVKGLYSGSCYIISVECGGPVNVGASQENPFLYQIVTVIPWKKNQCPSFFVFTVGDVE